MEKSIQKPESNTDQPVFHVYRTNFNNPKSETYLWPYSKEAIRLQAFNAQGWIAGFRIGCVRQ